MSIVLSLDLDGATVGDLQTFVRAIESTGAKSRTAVSLEGTVLKVHADTQAGPLNPTREAPYADAKQFGDQALNSLIDALISRRGNH
ncbi:hypothetical protein LJU02_07465 [Corynebacterium pseudotuberculosis]|uniref:Uncharacterized protein n=2 Tax=Corynebacterium pseudotuberculosis TaxID=1719 RepID=D9QBM0_CORP2|nr:hypothetical protein [Corynebacterium pseudotuberculosis]AER69501.1 Hypothetical protein Cp106_1442 [Corynebacterium pseudotuberculosis 1/06-A]ADK29279.2 hypothetical protein CPFRC_07450 [Corynebacterium pseudotuberculosis FRC41]ADL10946.1 hypothetical protein CPC231_07450 [Corynebacterium pseudotuberculosis C231]ADL21348.1 hypothetical protein CP1002_05695 [Corynebacterium pseudotuberculosis 1002]ADO26746.1 hypothetical protein CPI19_04070 [Corynebacterium pseudotuberculosis I19]